MKKALIFGINGQDGSHLTEYLYGLGYEVHGTIRSEATIYTNLSGYFGKVYLYYCDLRDEVTIENVIRKVHPDEIYNLAGQVFVPTSWEQPSETLDINVGGLARILKCVNKVCPTAKVYQASSSVMYGNSLYTGGSKLTSKEYDSAALHEQSKMMPVSPYAVSKLAAHKLIDVHRQRGMYAVSGILFNHEGPRRGREMVTRKITQHVARWACGDTSVLKLGDTRSRRDWGYAGDYVKAMHAMLQQPYPDDYVIGTGAAHSVQEFLQAAVSAAGLDWDACWKLVIPYQGEFQRPNDLKALVADYSKASRTFGWKPETNFLDLVKMMVENDISEVGAQKHEPTPDTVAVS